VSMRLQLRFDLCGRKRFVAAAIFRNDFSQKFQPLRDDLPIES
jgi:hypothetical protein